MCLTFFQIFVSLIAAHSYFVWESKVAYKIINPKTYHNGDTANITQIQNAGILSFEYLT